VTPAGAASAAVAAGEVRVVDLPMYQTDALVRRAPSLQKTREGRAAATTY
jgi:NADH-quinone oxidoreductase subunit G